MSYKNNEGYPDPTAGKAVRSAGRMPTHIYNAFCVLNNTAGLLGLEITGIRDRKNRKRMEEIEKAGSIRSRLKASKGEDTSGNRNPERKRREKRISEILSKSSEERKGYP